MFEGRPNILTNYQKFHKLETIWGKSQVPKQNRLLPTSPSVILDLQEMKMTHLMLKLMLNLQGKIHPALIKITSLKSAQSKIRPSKMTKRLQRLLRSLLMRILLRTSKL